MNRMTRILLAWAAASVCATSAQAAWNDGPITMIVPFSAGGSTDVLARVVAKDIGDDLGTSVIVENKPGAEGFIAARQLKGARPDGRTLMLATTSVYAINPAIFREIPYDPGKDFATVGMVASSPNVFLAASGARYANLGDIVEAARRKPDGVNYATGATMHLLNAKWIEALSGTRMTSVPYRGSAAAYPDLIAGRVDFMVDQPLSSMPFVQQGQLRPLAVTSTTRWPQMPDVPTVVEQGYPEFSTTSWWAVLAPAGTPQEILRTLHDALARGLARPETQEKIRQIGADISAMTLAESQAYTATELEKWRAIADAAQVKMD